jgi:hypothetical protein
MKGCRPPPGPETSYFSVPRAGSEAGPGSLHCKIDGPHVCLTVLRSSFSATRSPARAVLSPVHHGLPVQELNAPGDRSAVRAEGGAR